MDPNQEARLVGVEEALESLRNPTWVVGPVRKLLQKWSDRVYRNTVRNMSTPGPMFWKDSGQSRKSMATLIDPDPFPIWARVGSDLDRVRWGEYGTGALSEDPESSGKNHWPPGDKLDAWAAKKGIMIGKGENARLATGADVARMIGTRPGPGGGRGGLEPRRFLRTAKQDVEDQNLTGYIDEMLAEIEEEAAKRGAS